MKAAPSSSATLEDKLNYSFRDPALLEQALTHRSYAKDNNERLEFIGDAVLGYVVATMLYRMHPTLQEDSLSLIRTGVVRGNVLAEVARGLGVADDVRLGSGELKSGGRQRESILADVLEAIIGAVHEDGGIEASRALIERLFLVRIEALDLQGLKDAKTRLQELLQGAGIDLPEYSVASVEGADHARRYTVNCVVRALQLETTGDAGSRRAAEKGAAQAALDEIEARDLV